MKDQEHELYWFTHEAEHMRNRKHWKRREIVKAGIEIAFILVIAVIVYKANIGA
jgi:hypothetical protein